MASSTQTVVRYSALLGGIFYGFVHNRTVQKDAKVASEAHARQRREDLIKEARQAWVAKQAAKNSKSDLITDPEDPKFDLEKVIASWEKA